VIADARNGYPVVVKDITQPESDHRVREFKSSVYKFKNRFVAYSPIANAALMITRQGTVKLANFAEGKSQWTVVEVGDEQLEFDIRQWRSCSLGFFSDGTRGIAMDARGKLIIVDFSVERR